MKIVLGFAANAATLFPFQNLDDAKLNRELNFTANAKSVSKFNLITSASAGYDKTCSICKKSICFYIIKISFLKNQVIVWWL